MTDYEFLDYLVDRYITEKKTREEYATDKFKKRYKFTPLSHGDKTGVIEVNGEKRIVDLDTKNPLATANQYGKLVPSVRKTKSDVVDGRITIGKEYFSRIKNQKRRDAILNHEIGHAKFHSLFPEKQLKRDERKMTKKLSQTSLNTNGHFDADEIEADAYAARVSGKKHLKKAIQDENRPRTLRKTIAQQRNSEKIINTMMNDSDPKNQFKRKHKIEKGIESSLKSSEEMNDINRNIQNDYYKRSKALNLKELRNIKTIKDEADRVKKNKR